MLVIININKRKFKLHLYIRIIPTSEMNSLLKALRTAGLRIKE